MTTINTLSDLQNMANDLTDDYVLGADIDASATSGWNSGAGFVPVAQYLTTNRFTGSFDGAGYKITNLHINRPAEDYVGLFGSVDTSSFIKNVDLVNVKINGKKNVGGLIGETYNSNSGLTVSKCSVSGNVKGSSTWYAGGLVGGLTNGATVEDCSSTADVTGFGTSCVGGLVGWTNASATVQNCFAAGVVRGTSFVDAFIGSNNGTVTDCFYDKSNGNYPSSSATGKNTFLMAQESTFTNWDFTNDWDIHERRSYPYLRIPVFIHRRVPNWPKQAQGKHWGW